MSDTEPRQRQLESRTNEWGELATTTSSTGLSRCLDIARWLCVASTVVIVAATWMLATLLDHTDRSETAPRVAAMALEGDGVTIVVDQWVHTDRWRDDYGLAIKVGEAPAMYTPGFTDYGGVDWATHVGFRWNQSLRLRATRGPNRDGVVVFGPEEFRDLGITDRGVADLMPHLPELLKLAYEQPMSVAPHPNSIPDNSKFILASPRETAAQIAESTAYAAFPSAPGGPPPASVASMRNAALRAFDAAYPAYAARIETHPAAP